LAGKAPTVQWWPHGVPITAFYSAKSKQGLGLEGLASRGGRAYDSSPNFKFLKMVSSILNSRNVINLRFKNMDILQKHVIFFFWPIFQCANSLVNINHSLPYLVVIVKNK
jgi:hypothetical protein